MNERKATTIRAIVIGLIGAGAACFMVCWAELVVSTIQIAICQFAPAAVGLLLVVVILNAILRQFSRRLALGSHEIVIIYMMILVAALTTSRGLLERWFSTMVAVKYYATPANHWQELYFGHIPQWSVPWDVEQTAESQVVQTFYEGLRPGARIPWQAWIGPFVAWLPVVVSMLLSYAFLASILRRQWVDNEKLSFPLTQLPIEMARGESEGISFFSNKVMWLGFALPTFIFTLNGLHGLYPVVPQIPVEYRLNPVLAKMGRPWSDAGYTTAYFSMAAVGFSYFLPAEILLSLWVFYFFVRFENMVFSAFGASFEAMPLYPTSIWNGYQVLGAYLVLVGYFVKSMIPHLKRVWAAAMGGAREYTGSDEFVPYRMAVLGLGMATAVSIYWFTKLGMSGWMAALEVIIYVFVVVVVMARSVNEAGMLMTETSFRPVDAVKLFAPASALAPSTMTALSMADAAFTRDLRGNLLSTFLDGLKISDEVKLNRRHLFLGIAGSVVVTLTLGSALHLIIPYRHGAITLYGYPYQSNAIWGFRSFQPAMEAAQEYDARLPIFFGSGLGLALALSFMRARYTWWPITPLGLALSGSWSMIVFWCPILIGWLVKSAVVHYGGMKVYVRMKPVFLGLILGEFSQAVIWATIASIWRVPAPFFPWP